MNFFSSSASRLILPVRKNATPTAIPPRPLSASGKYASTEGRFTIIDEKCKESTSADSDSDHSEGDIEHQSITRNRVSIKCFAPSVALPEPPQAPITAPHMTTSGSRFKIVPVEVRYKRGRWACWDHYDSEPTKSAKGARIDSPPLSNHFDNNLTVTSVKSLPPVAITSPSATFVTVPQSRNEPVTFAVDLSDDSDAENTPPADKDPGSVENGNEASAYQLSRPQMTLFMDPAVSGQHDCVKRLVGSPDFFSTSGGRITPSEMIHNYGLERSLSATYSDKAILDLLPGSTAPAGSPQVLKAYPQSSATGPGPGGTPQMVAIDSKIEQAMDLVKTHLMFAVREEVEILRAKIIELETTVLQLEAENAVLREHVPAEILSKLSLQATQGSAATAAV